ncbi:hypothetical protein QO062_09680 [Fervidobacterium pennivorans subsp. carthaginiensis]|uniref:hypothetical protein n=1 Tax=Fervidobacterium pennivorans TaxID=93466 RepID=UPI00355B1E30
MRRIRRKLCGIISKTLSMARRIICEVPPLDCEPVSQLVREQHIVPRPCVPVVDSHTHLTMGRYRLGKMSNIKPKIDWDHKQLFEMLDFVGVEKVVDLTPFYGEKLKAVLDFHSPYKERIAVFGTVDFTTVDSKDFFKIVKKNIVDGYKNGMKGLKIFKELGLHYRDSNGRIIMPNDKRLRVIWETCAELSIPV